MRTNSTKPALGLTMLEAREVPAAVSFAGGLLVVNMNEMPLDRGERSATLQAVSRGAEQYVQFQRQTIQGGPAGGLRTKDVTAIVVNGSPQTDRINLQAVEGKYGFRNLDGRVEVSGGAGNDIIYGTAFNDRLSGGADNDFIKGGPGSDIIRGGAGNDELYGSGNSNPQPTDGNDLLYGEAGNDHLYGGGGNDTVVGGPGVDTFHSGGPGFLKGVYGSPGDDTVYYDAQDNKPNPKFGWRSLGYENAYAGNPPVPAYISPFKTTGHRSADGWLDPMVVV